MEEGIIKKKYIDPILDIRLHKCNVEPINFNNVNLLKKKKLRVKCSVNFSNGINELTSCTSTLSMYLSVCFNNVYYH